MENRRASQSEYVFFNISFVLPFTHAIETEKNFPPTRARNTAPVSRVPGKHGVVPPPIAATAASGIAAARMN